MGKIIFYEDKNFQGRSYECTSVCDDLYSHFRRCNSIRIESGNWMVYEWPHFMGYQYFLHQGEYADYQWWMGFNDFVRSCRMIPQVSPPLLLTNANLTVCLIYKSFSITDSCDVYSLHDRFHYNDIHSCNVQDGYWIFYEHPNYRGRQNLLRPGKYRRYSDWCAMSSRVSSIRCITL
uniref:Crystallin, gamma MX, like 1 n=1 Tax=Cyprinus carpio TaxID=7962 RepID=A0A8C1GTE2_CYPCA